MTPTVVRATSLYASEFREDDPQQHNEEGCTDKKQGNVQGSVSPNSPETVETLPAGEEEKQAEHSEVSSNDSEETKEINRSCIFYCMNAIGCVCIARIPERWPRTFWFLAGVVAPLWMLIGIATVCGHYLAQVESPNEILLNNEKLHVIYLLEDATNLVTHLAALTPAICLKIFLTNSSVFEQFPLFLGPTLPECLDVYEQVAILEARILYYAQLEAGDDTLPELMETTDALLFMIECGETIHTAAIGALKNKTECLRNDHELLGPTGFVNEEDLTFNWNRCANESLLDDGLLFDAPDRPEEQREHYMSTWKEDAKKINQTIYDATLPENATLGVKIQTRLKAELKASTLASGESACRPNFHAAGWFFFTVMTTIGYGNQSPTTAEGRAMLYTLGFLSILVFAGVATQSGRITVLLFDDMAKRVCCLRWLSRPLLATIFWGVLYWGWLVLIAFYTASWKQERMGEDFDFMEGYWFSFISTTTVGLGDFFLEPEVLIGHDLLIFSLIFLIGFVFLASFLGKLSAFFSGLQHVGGKTLEQCLAETSLCCGHGVAKAGANLSSNTTHAAYQSGQRVIRKIVSPTRPQS